MKLIDMLAGRSSDDPKDQPSGVKLTVEPSAGLLEKIDAFREGEETREEIFLAFAALGVISKKVVSGIFGALTGGLTPGASEPRVVGSAKGEIEEKRLYLPGLRLEATCPKCSHVYVRDFGDDYLSYPKVGEPEDLDLYCKNDDCGHEWKVRAQLDVTLKIMPKLAP